MTALIAIFGATGTGKTTFVNDASGGNLRVEHNSHSCTKDVQQSPLFKVDNRDVVLFDTPSFDNTNLSEVDVLMSISNFLAASYEHGHKLTGIVYMHPISDIRVGGSSRRNFNRFRKLCGEEFLSNVLLVTNIWSDPPTSQEINRETELRTHVDFFQPAIEQGATMVRHTHKNTQSAHEIIRMLLSKDPIVTRVQQELVDEKKDLSDTGAGREVGRELLMAVEKHKAEMEELQAELEKALRDSDERTQAELAHYWKGVEVEGLERLVGIAALKKGHKEARARWQRTLLNRIDKLQHQLRTVDKCKFCTKILKKATKGLLLQ